MYVLQLQQKVGERLHCMGVKFSCMWGKGSFSPLYLYVYVCIYVCQSLHLNCFCCGVAPLIGSNAQRKLIARCLSFVRSFASAFITVLVHMYVYTFLEICRLFKGQTYVHTK